MNPNIIIVVPSLHNFDAIGTDVILQRTTLVEAGWPAHIFAERVDAGLQDQVLQEPDFLRLIADPQSILIYHFGVFWHGLPQLLEQASGRIWVKYHNITPPEFYAGWDEGSYHATAAGQNQARWLATHPRVELFIGDSAFNLEELTGLVGHRPFQSTVLAPMVRLLVDETHPEEVPDLMEEGVIHVLFVGRVVPNKAHKHLIGTMRSFRDLYPEVPIRLHIAGANHPNFASYFNFLQDLANKAGIQEHITFWNKTSPATLKALYQRSTVFLCMSEHEGFCVPVIEAQQAGLPVIALARAAVPDTLGKEQLLLPESIDYDHTASLIYEVAQNSGLRSYLIDRGHANAARFSQKNLGQQLLQLVQNRI